MYASQRQRKFEREIRALKRELHACEDIGDVEKAKQLTGKIRDLTAEYKQFGDAVGLRAKTERIRVTELVANKIHVAEGTRAGLRRLGMVSNECVPFIETEFGGLSSSVVFCTEERMKHIMARHPQDYELFEKHAEECISKPDVLLKDAKNANTALFIRHIGTMNINAVVKLSIDERVNTLLTFYRIRESNLKKMMKKNKVLYEKHET